MKVVLDTNGLVSGTYWTGDSFKIMEFADDRKIELVLSKELIEEYHTVLGSDEITDKVADKKLILNKVVERVVSQSTIVFPIDKLNVVTEDPDDNKILACAKAGKVDFIISNDNHLLKLKVFEGISILTPTEFLKQLTK